MPKENSGSNWQLLRRVPLGKFCMVGAAALFLLMIWQSTADRFDKLTTRCHLLFTTYERVVQTQQKPPEGKKFCSTGLYQFEYPSEIHERRAPKSWEDVAALPCIYLNLGADVDRQGSNKNYENYIAVQGSRKTEGWGCFFNSTSQREECGSWCVCHDLRDPIPLPDSSVDRIHSEDFLEHIDHQHYATLFKEVFRLLKPGGRARFGAPDYSRPQSMINTTYPWSRHEEAIPEGSHRTLTNYALFKEYVEGSPFKKADFLQYFDNTKPGVAFSSRHLPKGSFRNSEKMQLPWVGDPINYTLGFVRRTPDADCRNNILKGTTVTSVVFDLVKDPIVKDPIV